MTLDEAIEYFRLLSKEDAEKAEELQAKQFINFCEVHRHKKNSTDHLQFAGWLRELKERRNAGWISCKERMPEDNTTVLYVWRSENGNVSVFHGWHGSIRGLGGAWHQSGVGMQRPEDEVTHWMSLPEPPKD